MTTTTSPSGRCSSCYRPLTSDTEPVCGCDLPPHAFQSGSTNGRACAACQRGGSAKIHRAQA